MKFSLKTVKEIIKKKIYMVFVCRCQNCLETIGTFISMCHPDTGRAFHRYLLHRLSSFFFHNIDVLRQACGWGAIYYKHHFLVLYLHR